MHVLLIGSGGREHALATLLVGSSALERLSVTPGNPGTAAFNLSAAGSESDAFDVSDHDAVVSWCQANRVDLVVVGPEAPLVAGIADALTQAGIACFGPSAAAARLEGSKAFTREFAAACGIPQPASASFTDSAEAIAWLDRIGVEVVVKADGLAAGKGVIIPADRAETVAAIRAMLDQGELGPAGARIVLEERMVGEELSLFGVSDGTLVVSLTTAQDHKRVGQGDTGPNTGGMGAFAPVPGVDQTRQSELAAMFLEPVVAEMAARGTPYVGVLYAGIMLTESGPKLVEYNCRFGDPEAQVILPLVESDGLELLAAAATGTLDQVEVTTKASCAATVVVAADGYPGTPRRGVPLGELPRPEHGWSAATEGVFVYQAGTALDGDRLVSSGGRVLAVTGLGADLDAALDHSYRIVDGLVGGGLFARSDIGWRHSRRRPAQESP